MKLKMMALLLMAGCLQGQTLPGYFDSKVLDAGQVKWHITNTGQFVTPGLLETGEGHPTACYPADQDTAGLLYQLNLIVVAQVGEHYQALVARDLSDFQPGTLIDGEPADPNDALFKVHRFNRGDVIPQQLVDLGCPPALLGEQMAFAVYNDAISHERYNDFGEIIPYGELSQRDSTFALNLEIRQVSHTSTEDEALQHTLFNHYTLINRGDKAIDSLFVLFNVDGDIGYYADDYMGSDIENSMVFFYNGTLEDSLYRDAPPALGCMMLPADLETAGGQITLETTSEGTGLFTKVPNLGGLPFKLNPDLYLWNLATGYRPIGLEWEDPFTGAPTHFPLSGDPVTGTGWLNRHISQQMDARATISSKGFSLKPGQSHNVHMALVAGAGLHRDHSIQVLRQHAGRIKWHWQWNVAPWLTTDVAHDDGTRPEGLTLHAAYPNPFNPATTLRFDLPRTGETSLAIYNIRGRRIETLSTGALQAGCHTVSWNAARLPSGLYIARLTQGHQTATAKLLLQK